ncbi:AraC family transcriptional regulator [Acidisoma cellulosilytica]|uniref:AraC family transcriptional regulator n=1 Tax=Acidisoma cellulosilyticum TaxID=2802395 RepID=A0A963Z6I0_9PROT|nr:AraC family transcriptional regulator [Acidisoma cellulosilyticum]MCB8883406.1 AraC family transcriptional regulator [Acidisoma cellulosilyticum]
MSDALKRAVWRYTDAHASSLGLAETPVAGLTLMRHYAPTQIAHVIYKPLVCLVLQGAKEVMAGDQVWRFNAGQSLLVNVDLPAIGRITRATRTEPYLAVAFQLDMAVMRGVMKEMAAVPPAAALTHPPLFVEETEDVVLDSMSRLVRLIDRPEAGPVLGPAIIKELHYWLLMGRHGAHLRRLAPADSHMQRIARAIALLREEFTQPLRVERLAEAAGMSPSSFHQHFKTLTAVSPLQFQKQLRLLEARRLMLAEGQAAAQAGFAVGYESASQFTREYGRMFGNPPKRDVTDSRAAA